MTRGKWVALAVGLAVVAVLVVNGPALWRSVAYVKEQRKGLSDGARLCIFIGSATDSQPIRWSGPMEVDVFRKRYKWLPGQEVIVPDQPCIPCNGGLHDWCWNERRERPPFVRIIRGTEPQSAPFRCTCPHPSHAESSE